MIGGFYPGELSVWTGKRDGGKSTLLGQLLLEALDQGFPVCAYSGELPTWRFKHWISLQAAGPGNVVERKDRASGKTFYTVPQMIQRRLDEWWAGRFWLYDNRLANDDGSILRIFEYAVRRYGCCVFLVDNLMTARLAASERNFYRAQGAFTGRLVELPSGTRFMCILWPTPGKPTVSGPWTPMTWAAAVKLPTARTTHFRSSVSLGLRQRKPVLRRCSGS